MTKLIRVANVFNEIECIMPTARREVTCVNPRYIDEHMDYVAQGEFFYVDDLDVDDVVRYLTKERPGREVCVYDLVSINICPAGEMVIKNVSKNGILPS